MRERIVYRPDPRAEWAAAVAGAVFGAGAMLFAVALMMVPAGCGA